MNRYEEKKQNRINYYKGKAAQSTQTGQQSINQSIEMISGIPAGQPILVGHHSEKGHRHLLKKSDNKMRKGVEQINKAEYYAQKAEAAENNTAISSDDPEATTKLNERIETLKEYQEYMKEANKYYKKNNTFTGFQNMTEEESLKLISKLSFNFQVHGKPYPTYALSINNQNIKRLKDRVKALEARDNLLEKTDGWKFDGGSVYFNQEENRIQVFFDNKPDKDIRTELKQRGFHWSPRNIAWQRHLNDNGIYAAKQIDSIKPIEGETA